MKKTWQEHQVTFEAQAKALQDALDKLSLVCGDLEVAQRQLLSVLQSWGDGRQELDDFVQDALGFNPEPPKLDRF